MVSWSTSSIFKEQTTEVSVFCYQSPSVPPSCTHHVWKSCHGTESGNISRSTCKMQGVTVKLPYCCSELVPPARCSTSRRICISRQTALKEPGDKHCQTNLILRHIQSSCQDFLHSWTSQTPERLESGQLAKFLPRSPGFPQQKLQLSASSLYLMIHLSVQQGGDRGLMLLRYCPIHTVPTGTFVSFTALWKTETTLK